MCPRSVQLKCPIHAQVCKHDTGECTPEPGHSKLREDDESILSTSRPGLFQTSRPIRDEEWTRDLNAAMKAKASKWGEEIQAVVLYRRGRPQFKVTGKAEGQDRQWFVTHFMDNMKTSEPSTMFGEARAQLVAKVSKERCSEQADGQPREDAPECETRQGDKLDGPHCMLGART